MKWGSITSLQDIMYADASSMDTITSLPVPTRIKTNPFPMGLPQEILQRMLLPMGNLTKARVREIAAERGFLKAAHKRDSLGVCFCPMDYRTFLHKELPEGSILPGKFFDEMGNFIARHKGYPFYTIGQRRGLDIDLNRAVFVKEIIPAENKVILSDLKALEKQK